MVVLGGLQGPTRRAGAGLIFRFDDANFNYVYTFDAQGICTLQALPRNDGNHAQTLFSNPISSFIPGAHHTNRLAVKAVGHTLTLYVNGHLIKSLQEWVWRAESLSRERSANAA